MSKHTPGPWTVAKYETTKTMIDRLQEGPQMAICTNHDPSMRDEMLVAICGDFDDETSKHDAHIIASAPEMYVLLQELLECHGVIKEYRDDVKKVLDKASGSDVEFTFEGE